MLGSYINNMRDDEMQIFYNSTPPQVLSWESFCRIPGNSLLSIWSLFWIPEYCTSSFPSITVNLAIALRYMSFGHELLLNILKYIIFALLFLFCVICGLETMCRLIRPAACRLIDSQIETRLVELYLITPEFVGLQFK